MLTRLKNGQILDLANVTAIHYSGDTPTFTHVEIVTNDGYVTRCLCDDPKAYADELSYLVAKAQGSGQ